MEAPEQISEPPAHDMTPTANTPDCQRYAVASRSSQFADLDMHGLLTVDRRRCDRAAATLLLLSQLMSRWEVGHNCLLGRYEASGGVWHSRLVKEGGLNEEDNWITRLQ
eukprot:scaffold21722_cov62-Attheya_sp.AAC.1